MSQKRGQPKTRYALETSEGQNELSDDFGPDSSIDEFGVPRNKNERRDFFNSKLGYFYGPKESFT